MSITVEQIKSLRIKTGLSINLCKDALLAVGGVEDKAIEYLEKQSMFNGKQLNAGTKGLIKTYEHNGSRIGVLVEISCNTDFVAKNEEIKEFATNVAMQIASMNPQYVSFDSLSNEIIETRKQIFLAQLGDTVSKKPQAAIDSILNGKLKKWATESCLLQQPFFLDEKGKTIGEIQSYLSNKFGELITIKRFERYEIY